MKSHLITILLGRRGWLAVAAIIGRLRGGRVLLWWSACVSSAHSDDLAMVLTERRRAAHILGAGVGHSFEEAEGRN